ncbi:MAG: UDP-3-O-(3-hydroxymyristoyl)glucosamine N-acyltransferase [Candidatus Cloacimonadales bacterium]
MKKFSSKLSAKKIKQILGLSAEFAEDKILDNVAQLQEADSSSVCFFENPQYQKDFIESQAGLIFVPENLELSKPDCILIKSAQPYLDFMLLIRHWLASDNKPKPNVARSAVIDPEASLGQNVSIGENVIISKGAQIGDNCLIDANCVIKENVIIGEQSQLYPNVTVYHDCQIGKRNILHAGVVIGADGFGYIFHEGQHHKVPQVGNVILEDDVEIGANSCIDRGALASTLISAGSKLDNLVQIGHNCKIGKNSIICAQTGIAGSTKVGNVVYIGGQAGLAGHITIEDYVQIGAQSGVTNSLKQGQKVFGTPAIDASLRKRIMISEKSLPEIARAYKREKRKKV